MMKNMERAPSLTHRALAGFIALFVALMSTIGISTAPSAHAQVPPGVGAEGGAAAAELTKGMVDVMIKVCNAEGADGTAVMECLQKAGLDAMQVADLTACLAGTAAGADDNENSTGPTDPEGGTTNEKLRECLNEFLGEEPEEEQTQDADDLSLGRMASALSSLYVNALVPGGTDAGQAGDDGPMDATDAADAVADAFTEDDADMDVLETWSKGLRHASSAGSFLGRPDSKEKLNTQWLMGPGDSRNNAVYSYSALDRQGFTNDNLADSFADAPDKGTFAFAAYGAALSGMGFDETISSDAAFDANRKILGSTMLLAYVAAGLVDTIFSAAISVLQYLNPFNLLLDGIKENTNAQFTAGIGGDEIPNSSFDGLKEFVSTVYTGAVNLGWQVTIPIFFALTIIGLFMFNGRNKGRNIKHLLIRMFFIIIMVPLLGVTYTSALDSMEGATGDAATGSASKIVLSTYVDFQGWFENSRLDLPSGAGTLDYDARSGAPTDESQAGARNFALAINATNNDAWESLKPASSAATANWGSQMTSEQEQINAADGTGKSTVQFTEVVNLLQRYIDGDTISAGGYESDVKASLTALGQKYPDDAKAIQDWVKKYTNVEALMTVKSGGGDGGADDMVNPLIFTKDSDGGAPALVAMTGEPGIVKLSKTDHLNRENCSSDLVASNGWNGDASDKSAHSVCAMSPLAAYNYLNTSFDSLSATTYSPDQSTSQFTRLSHASVSAVGSGAMPYVYWFSSMTLLVSFSLIGILYAMFMVINTIRRGFQLIAAIPFGAMGFMAGIAKSIVYVIAMFLEIFLTFFVFKLVQEFLLVMPQLIETPLIGQMSGEGAEVGGLLGGLGAAGLAASNPLTVVTVVTVISTFGVILFTIMALKLRSTLISAMDEAVARAINRFTDSNVTVDGGGQPGALRQGIARGAGMAAAHQMMSGGGDSGDGDAGQAGAPGEPGAADDAPRTNFGGSDGPGDGMAAAGVVDGTVDGSVDGGMDGQDGGYSPDDGSYSVGEDGVIRDSDGAVIDNGNGEPMTLDGMGATNKDGNLVTADGGEIVGADGKPISAEGVAGIDANGALLDANGNAITDANGQVLGVDPSGTGVGAAGYTAEGGDGMRVDGGAVGAGASGTGDVQSVTGEGQQSIDSLPGAQSQQYEMAGVSSDTQTQGFAGTSGGVSAGEAGVAGGLAGGVAGAAARSMSGGNGQVADAVSGAANNVAQAAPAMMQNAQQIRHQMSGGGAGPVGGGAGPAAPASGFGAVPMTGAPSGAPSGTPVAPAGTAGMPGASGAQAGAPGAAGAPGGQSPSARQAGYTNVAHTTVTGGPGDLGNIARTVAGGVVGGAVTNAVAGNRRRGVAHEATGGQAGGGDQAGGGQSPMNRRRGGANRMADGQHGAGGRGQRQRGRGENFNMSDEVQRLQMHQRRVDQMRRDNGIGGQR